MKFAPRTSKWTVAAALAVASLPALAVDWDRVAATASQTVLIDRDSVHAFNGDVRARVMHSYSQTQTLGDIFPHRSNVILYSVDCGKRELGYLQWSMQSQELGAGRTVWADSVNVNGVSYYRAGTDVVDNALVDSVCSLYALHAPMHHGLSVR
jgi:hypothetical protein